MYSQSITGGNRNVKHGGLSLQMERWRACFLPTSLGMQVVNNLVTFELTVGPRLHQILFIMEDIMCSLQRF